MDGWQWEHSKDPDLEPFYRRRNELSIQQGCVLWGIRVIVAFKLQKPVLSELHEGHAGIARMKSLAKSHIYGGQTLMLTLNVLLKNVILVNKYKECLPHLLFTRGLTLQQPGNGLI